MKITTAKDALELAKKYAKQRLTLADFTADLSAYFRINGKEKAEAAPRKAVKRHYTRRAKKNAGRVQSGKIEKGKWLPGSLRSALYRMPSVGDTLALADYGVNIRAKSLKNRLSMISTQVSRQSGAPYTLRYDSSRGIITRTA